MQAKRRTRPVLLVCALCAVATTVASSRDVRPALYSPRSGPSDGPPVNREILWSQPYDLNGTKVTSEIINAFALETEVADDFVLLDSSAIRAVTIWGGNYNWTPGDPDITTLNLRFHEDDGCRPGGILVTYGFPAIADFVGYDGYGYPTYRYDTTVDFEAMAGRRYWLTAQAGDHPFPPQWGRQQSLELQECGAMFRSVFFGYPDWVPVGDLVGVPYDAAFELDADPVTLQACCFELGTCRMLSPPRCERGGGLPQGEGSVCDPNPCRPADEPRACCLQDHTCEVLTAEACAQRGGDSRMPGDGCDPNPCVPEPVTHACCFGSGMCMLMYQQDCVDAGGLPQGACTVCDPNPCPQPGACCYDDGRCEVLFADACEAQGGIPQGEGTTCAPNPCPQPQACCFADGRCALLQVPECEAQGGIPHGEGTLCAPNPCPQPQACCFQAGSCRVLLPDDCARAGGIAQGEGSACEPNPCPPAETPRACCLADQSCEVLGVADCVQRGGDPRMPGEGCDPNPCAIAPIARACCFGDGSCRVLLHDECIAAGGLPQGACTVCDPNPCPQPGACCYDDGRCEVLFADECIDQGGTPQGGGTDCDPNLCPQPQACCFHDGSCTIALPAGCHAAGGTPMGNGTDCTPNPCPQPQACCFTFGTCRIYHPEDCAEQGGTSMGNDVACEPNPCAPPSVPRACCFVDETCRILSAEQCAAMGGRALEAGATCDPNPCLIAVIQHACCFGDGICRMLTTGDCTAQGGLPQGICQDCSPNPCADNPCDKKAALLVRPADVVSSPTPFFPRSAPPNTVEGSREVCWSEPADLNDAMLSSEIIAMYGLESEVANDFLIPDYDVSKAIGYGGYYNWVPGDPPITSLNWKFYDDGGCVPRNLLEVYMGLGTETFIGCDSYGYPVYKYELHVDFQCVAGELYWLGLQAADHPFPPQWGRQGAGLVTNCDSVFKSAFFGYPYWTPAGYVIGAPYDAAQELECGGSPTPIKVTTWGKVKALFRSAPATGAVQSNPEEVSR